MRCAVFSPEVNCFCYFTGQCCAQREQKVRHGRPSGDVNVALMSPERDFIATPTTSFKPGFYSRLQNVPYADSALRSQRILHACLLPISN